MNDLKTDPNVNAQLELAKKIDQRAAGESIDDLKHSFRALLIDITKLPDAKRDMLVEALIAYVQGHIRRRPAAAPDLHAAIMNLPCNEAERYMFEHRFYKEGHRDARHAAAELVAAAEGAADIAAARPSAVAWQSIDAWLDSPVVDGEPQTYRQMAESSSGGCMAFARWAWQERGEIRTTMLSDPKASSTEPL